MAEVVPALLADDPADYGHKLNRLKFTDRIHLDIALPPFTPTRTIGLAQLHLPETIKFDLHLMIEKPNTQIETVISLHPHLAIVHFESQGDLAEFFTQVSSVGVKKGVAILPDTTVEQAEAIIKLADHVLVFTGHLGYYGGQMRTDCLEKINQVKQLKPGIEVGVDGGVSPDNIDQVVAAGADIIISGGFIVNSDDPKRAYAELAAAGGLL